MGGESIKPIRKRIHVYFLMTTYQLIIILILLLKFNDDSAYFFISLQCSGALSLA